MTEFNLYCDESRHTSDPSQNFAVIGALQCAHDEKRRIVHRLHSLMGKYNVQGEWGWKKLSPNREAFYHTLIDLFCEESGLSFRCLTFNKKQLDHVRFNDGDQELGFYKLYYQMLVHWLKPQNSYYIYLDWQLNQQGSRFVDLKSVLINKLSGRAKVLCLEPVDSKTQPLLQLADLFIGAIGYQLNELDKLPGHSQIKHNFITHLERHLNRQRLSTQTPFSENKFNVFNWQGS